MNSFGGSQEKYQAWGDQLKAHAAMDQLVKGVGWENGKGCFIGCSIHNYSHERFAEEFGLPKVIPELADSLFECCDAEAVDFALQIFEAIRVGVNYEKFIHHWCEWLILDPTYGAAKFNPDTRIRAVGLLHREAKIKEVPIEQWKTAAADTASAYAAAVGTARAYAAASAYAAARAYAAAASGADVVARVAASGAASRASAYAASAYTSAAYVTAYARAAQRQQFLKLLKSDAFPIEIVED